MPPLWWRSRRPRTRCATAIPRNDAAVGRADIHSRRPTAIVVDTNRSEFRNALVGYIRRRILSTEDARHIIREAEEQIPLVTADRQIQSALPAVARELASYARS
jgi:hypothetical protein